MSSRSFAHFIARRYLFSRKKLGAINIVSIISVAAIAFCTAALVCTLSVFNGFRDLIGSLYTQFDPELTVQPTQGKFLSTDSAELLATEKDPDVAAASFTLTDNALILFQGRPTVITLKGVDPSYDKVTGIRKILYGNGQYELSRANIEYGIPGLGLASTMGTINYGTLQICAPRRGERVNLANPVESFNTGDIVSPGVCFNVNQKRYDENYLITSLRFAQDLFEQPAAATALELKLHPGADTETAKQRIQQRLGASYRVLDRLEQQQDVFNIMAIEKTMAYLFLTFILLIACFNIVGSVSMLIIDKRHDALTLRHLGASHSLIARIFMTEGRFICVLGAVVGTLIGVALCWVQQEFGLIKMGEAESNFIISAYPVSIHLVDVLLILLTVIIVGFGSVWYPVKYLSRKFLG